MLTTFSQQESDILLGRLLDGDKGARDKFIEMNIPLVAAIAKNYVSSGIPFEDLTQEGIAGMIHSLTKYDASKGFKFSTYATWWIRQHIEEMVLQSGVLRKPANYRAYIKAILGAKCKILEEGGNPNDPQQIADVSGIKLNIVQSLIDLTRPPAELDAPFPFCEDVTRKDAIVDLNDDCRPEKAVDNLSCKAISNLLGFLSKREQEVIRMRFCIGEEFVGKEKKSLREIGRMMDLSAERIRQIETRALKKLRSMMQKHQDLRFG